VKPNTWKKWGLESSRTPECLELDSKAQNNSHWGVLGVIGKVLKRRYRKCPRIGHLDICRPSYGQKKRQESNWQFDSRPLKVGNRPLPEVWIGSATLKVRNQPLPEVRIGSAIRRWTDLDEGYKFGLNLVVIRSRSRELWAPKVPGLHPGRFRDNFGLHFGSPGNLCHLDVAPTGRRRVYYRGVWWWHTPESWPWCVLWSEVPVACPNTQGCLGMWTNHVGGLFWCRFMLNLLNLLPSLIPGLPTRPSTPF